MPKLDMMYSSVDSFKKEETVEITKSHILSTSAWASFELSDFLSASKKNATMCTAYTKCPEVLMSVCKKISGPCRVCSCLVSRLSTFLTMIKH